MPIFISWSGETSKRYADVIRTWVRLVAPGESVFYSPTIAGGAIGIVDIISALEKSTFGIICLTPDNLDSSWLHFEAGAILNNLGSSLENSNKSPVVPLLCAGLALKDLKDPLRLLQAKQCDKDGLLDLAEALNISRADRRLDLDVVENLFLLLWHDLESELKKIDSERPAGTESSLDTAPVSEMQALRQEVQELALAVRQRTPPSAPQRSRLDAARSVYDFQRELESRIERAGHIVRSDSDFGPDIIIDDEAILEMKALPETIATARQRMIEAHMRAQQYQAQLRIPNIILAFVGTSLPYVPDVFGDNWENVNLLWTTDGKVVWGNVTASKNFPYLLDHTLASVES